MTESKTASSDHVFGSVRPASLVVSIVSHGHAALIQSLLWSMADSCAKSVARVVVTLNLPDEAPKPPAGGWPFELQVVRNAEPKGFGSNHNHALRNAQEAFVCVLNPDVELEHGEPFSALVSAASEHGVGAAYPLQVDEDGAVQDSERSLPTPAALFRRHFRGEKSYQADWVNAACLLLPSAVWRQLGGFDERYFMYCEDVDLCLRVRLLGLALVRADARVVHAGTRASRGQWRHLAWHVTSLVRLWRSRAYRDGRKLLQAGSAAPGSIGLQ